MNWRDLQEPSGANTVAEIRITDWYPNWAGAQVPFLRLLRNTTRFEAQLFVWWPKRDSPPMPRAGIGIQCGDRSDPSEVCVKSVPVPAGYDWDDVATRVMQLTEPCRPDLKSVQPNSGGLTAGEAGVVGDAGDLLVEASAGHTYRTYWCNAPASGTPVRPVDRAALGVYTLLRELGRSSPRFR